MKKYKGVPWQEFIAYIGNSVKTELEWFERQSSCGCACEFESSQTGYGKFGSMESNYTLRKADLFFQEKVFTIHDNSAEGITPKVWIYATEDENTGYNAWVLFRRLEKSLGIDLRVEYA